MFGWLNSLSHRNSRKHGCFKSTKISTFPRPPSTSKVQQNATAGAQRLTLQAFLILARTIKAVTLDVAVFSVAERFPWRNWRCPLSQIKIIAIISFHYSNFSGAKPIKSIDVGRSDQGGILEDRSWTRAIFECECLKGSRNPFLVWQALGSNHIDPNPPSHLASSGNRIAKSNIVDRPFSPAK